VGLCHSIPTTARVIESLLGLDAGELRYVAAGINHQAWFLEVQAAGRDVSDDLRDVLRSRFLPQFGGTTPWQEGELAYLGGQERVRAELLETFGFFLSESSHHASEYVPYFRRSAQSVKAHLPRRWDYLRGSLNVAGQEDALVSASVARLSDRLEYSGEFGMRVIAAQVGGPQAHVYVNVRNDGWVANLPADACVEVPALVNEAGVHPTEVGRLPGRCAGLNLTGIALQTAVVEAVIQRDFAALVGTFALDPLTASLVDLPDIRRMAAELLVAEAAWLPAWLRPQVRL
jgi:alpha-galactosidase